jgi:hypothetical protein
LEHIEPDCIDEVLEDLRRLTKSLLYATICTVPARKKLPDGRNTHVLQQPMEWWRPKLEALFDGWKTSYDKIGGGGTFLFTANKVTQ